jgi:peptidoglycan/LPS O-acetylase OafA/YrhL
MAPASRHRPSRWPSNGGRVFHAARRLALLLLAATTVLCQAGGGALALNSVLDVNGTFPYLIDRLTGALIEPRDYMDFENIYTPNETYRLHQTAQGRNYHLIKAFDFANYFQSDYWHYSSRDDLVRSAEPVADASKCADQLDWLEGQLNRSNGAPLFQPGEQHVNLMTLFDSFGHPEAATYLGHGYWLGSYHECKRAAIDVRGYQVEECHHRPTNGGGDLQECHKQRQQDQPPIIKFRYCIGKAHDIDWPTNSDNYVPKISYKVGLCLPEACETLTYERRPQQLERLMRFNLPEYTKRRISLHEIYCLPDERSPIRRLPLASRIFLALCCLWLAALLVATVIYSCHKRHQADVCEILAEEQRLVGANGLKTAATTTKQATITGDRLVPTCTDSGAEQADNECACDTLLDRPHKMLMMSGLLDRNKAATADQHIEAQPAADSRLTGGSRSNVSRRSGTSAASAVSAWLSATETSPALVGVLKALSIEETLLEFKRPPRALSVQQAVGGRRRLSVNLNALDAIKCLCCVLVIFGHIIFIHMQHLSNIVHTIELSYEIYPRFLIALFNFVDTFFIISGMLTSYFIFKRFNKRSFSSPLVWLYISLMRLLRLSPVYVLVFWFIKTTSVYMTNGPIWDYGTDKNSIKGLCINDHWWKSILYLGDVGSMQPICILPAWSIIVDAQYSLVTPAIIYLIFKHRRTGYLLLLAATLVSTTKMTLQLANQTAVKTSDMAKIRLHVYPLISRFAAEFYNTAWNRIGPVAIGIFGGHMLHLYESGSLKRWPAFMYGAGFKLALGLHVLIFLLPVLGRFTDDPKSAKETDTAIFILSNATIKPIWSIINTILLLRLITDLRSHSLLARLMSHNIWHCLGKLCFTSYLIHYEIILTLLKSREGLVDPNWMNAFREFSAVFLISTAISYVVYILYEAPMNKLIMLAFARQADRLKTQQQCHEGLDASTSPGRTLAPGGGGGKEAALDLGPAGGAKQTGTTEPPAGVSVPDPT